MRKWEQKKVNKLAYGLLIGIVAGLILGIIFKNMGVFLPIGGIAGMCVGVVNK